MSKRPAVPFKLRVADQPSDRRRHGGDQWLEKDQAICHSAWRPWLGGERGWPEAVVDTSLAIRSIKRFGGILPKLPTYVPLVVCS